ncbi:transmembrane protein 192 [Tribolium castaneum]|uniref:Transmembrane protein 192 n=1 Tax=Tribolium castaneum TaxID=7070 RepID=D6WSQ0_TRICA|nr:PREDICTED: transmembrane protein 192 [Tribolium castaneum]EFA05885.1 Transmembrane protein 192-like Protein [Tribolium castaneum]|eukprot:XP_971408.3 PREDICTED: transmembrane protein 192 [Tribolium castaneum]
MVSLSRSFNTNSGGATFFSESGNMGDPEHLQPILESYGTFRPLNTVPVFSLHLLFTLALEIVAIVFAVQHPDEKYKCREYFIIIYIHAGLWFLTLIVDQIARRKHYNLRILGYLEFYNKTHIHHRLPLYVVSLWNAVIMIIQAIAQQFYPDNFAEKCINGGTMSPIGYLCALITFEFCLIAGININYIFKVQRFNKQKAPPDVQREEWNASMSPEATEIGSPLRGEKLYDFLQKQADLIRFLKEHNAKLGEKLMVLSAQMQARG